ncbi:MULTISPECIES: HPF/RaiA family ribosome-associated protein [Chitinibacter]|uniref:HPF/RaiA family ribosome-associated protein n=1 Tax=Chitinibacter TaxID=230666 RepID=UPI00041E85DA|nr:MULTISPECIES: HPF/RaiA family ribosome-associated protein [Chitinibacter]
MKIEISSQGVALDEKLQRHIARQIEFGLGRLASHIRKVTVRLSDVNGPRGGVDQHCQLVISLHQIPDVIIEDVATDQLFAINRATDRASRTVSRRVRQSRGFAPVASPLGLGY